MGQPFGILSKPFRPLSYAVVPTARLTPPENFRVEKRRRKLGDLSTTLHCSIIGTCLGTAALRRLVFKATDHRDEDLSDHEIHKLAVSMASARTIGSKLLHKALDEQHAAAIRRFDKAADVAELKVLWDQARARGEIPGAYWAIITHPLATEPLVRDVFGDVHMLSHLVGAANRADIRRLAEIEAENARLGEKTRRQEERMRQSAIRHAAEVERLQGLALDRIMANRDAARNRETPDGEDLEQIIARLDQKSRKDASRLQTVEAERDRLLAEVMKLKARVSALVSREARLECEVAALESHIDAPVDESRSPPLDLRVLYVGGLSGGVRQLSSMAGARGIAFEHHDGGQQEATSMLPGMIGRADIVLFPVDCISHDAANVVKRQCKLMEKRWAPLRSAGLGCFLRTLDELARDRAN